MMIKTKNIIQTVLFNCAPKEVYEALMDSKKHSLFSQSKATISRRVGGKISAYDGWIQGKNVKLVPNQLIVQKWRGADWPKGHFSEVTFDLKKIKTGTKLVFTHQGVPLSFVKDIAIGWKDHYWKPMRKMLEK